jgi:hypothetical protein
MTQFRVIDGILLHEAVTVKPKHIVLLKKNSVNPKSEVFLLKFEGFIRFSIKTIAALCFRWQCPDPAPPPFLAPLVLDVSIGSSPPRLGVIICGRRCELPDRRHPLTGRDKRVR